MSTRNGKDEQDEKDEKALELTLALENLCFAWATESPEKRGGIFGYLSGRMLRELGAERVHRITEEINRVVREETGRLLLEMKEEQISGLLRKLVDGELLRS